jgi:DHA2 family multidrug resistance protein
MKRKLMMILSLAVVPLVLLLRRAPTSAENDHAMAME